MSVDTPVGTIISSTFNYKDFLKAVLVDSNNRSDPSNIPIPSPIGDPAVSLWVPADGREVKGSLYARLSKDKPVPDLRGVFLRGINSHGVEYNKPIASGFADPDGNREAGSLQKHELVAHHHSMTYRVPGNGGSSGEPGNEQGLSDETRDTADFGGQETRPSNAAVYYYVKIN